jgi:Tfp pilus assembly protein FimT
MRPRQAFTVIELVSVLGIAVLLLSLVLGSYTGWTRARGVEAAAREAAAVLGHARELAITQLVETRVSWENLAAPGRADRGALATFTNETSAVLATNLLPPGVCFSNQSVQSLWFLPDGGCRFESPDSNNCARLVLRSAAGAAARPLTRVIEVNQLSGRIRVRREDEP